MPIELGDVRSGYSLSIINNNFQEIERRWDEKLDRLLSTQGNQMIQNLDMNGFQLLNAFVGTVNLSQLGQDLAENVEQTNANRVASEAARDAAEGFRDESQGFRDEASTFADAAEASADRVIGLTSLPVLEWAQGTTTTNGTQRYLFNNVLYIAPSATASNPVSLGATPIGDSNWVDWSVPIFFFSYEEILQAATATIQLPSSFIEISDVYVGGIAQPSNAYTVNTANSTLTFNETLPVGTFVKVWTGRPRDAILTDYVNVSANANSIGLVTPYTSPALVSATDIIRPDVAFNVAEISVSGVMQIPGASNSYVIEVDGTDITKNQIRFSEQLPVGSIVYGLLRSV